MPIPKNAVQVIEIHFIKPYSPQRNRLTIFVKRKEDQTPKRTPLEQHIIDTSQRNIHKDSKCYIRVNILSWHYLLRNTNQTYYYNIL